MRDRSAINYRPSDAAIPASISAFRENKSVGEVHPSGDRFSPSGDRGWK